VLAKHIGYDKTHDIMANSDCKKNVLISAKLAQTLQFFRENVYRNLLDAST